MRPFFMGKIMLDTQIEPNDETTTTESAGSPGVEQAEVLKTESESQSDATTDESGDLPDEVYYDVDGEEVSAADIKKWKSGHLMQSDSTRKTQALADDRKRFQSERDELDAKLEMLRSAEADLEGLIMADLQGKNLDELREYDVSEYLKVTETQKKRSAKLAEISQKFAKAQQELADRGFKQLSESLGWDANPEKFESDKKTLADYAKATGITDRDFQKIVSPAVMTAILEAAKYRKLKESNPADSKRVKAVPKIVKPAKSVAPRPLSLAEKMYGKKSS